MRVLTDTALLDLWQRGQRLTPVERALLLLAAALPEQPTQALTDINIPWRDAAVLNLRCAMFGSRLPGIADCPHCGERLEFEFDAAALAASDAAVEEEIIRIGNLRFRLPNSSDLLTAAATENQEQATRRLLRDCCVDTVGDEQWPDTLYAEIEAGMATLADAADISFHFDCENCGRGWEAPFDICAYFWEEIEGRARQLLDDIHRLALAYHWSERDILALGDARRAAYLDRCDA